MFQEQRIDNKDGVDIRVYDERINDIEDHTIIDGEFQDERYWEHRRDEVDEWLRVEPLDLPDNLCVIGFRGGEYVLFPDLFLPPDYWINAMKKMKDRNPDVEFLVVTDDPDTAMRIFPRTAVQHEIGSDWRHIRYAKNLILSNSSFYIFPAWLNKGAYIIAPHGWARHNLGYWALPQNKYKGWNYLDRKGDMESYNEV